MVRASIAAAVVLVLIVACGIFENILIKKDFDYFDGELQKTIELADNNNADTQRLEKLLEWWKDKKTILHIYVPHNEIRDINSYMVEAINYIKKGEFAFATSKLRNLSDIVEALPKGYTFSMGNVF